MPVDDGYLNSWRESRGIIKSRRHPLIRTRRSHLADAILQVLKQKAMPSAPMPPSKINRLPTELILQIARYLSYQDINALLRICKSFHTLLTPLLFHAAAASAVVHYSKYQRSPPIPVLHWAIAHEKTEIVTSLLTYNAPACINRRDNEGITPIWLAVHKKHTKIANQLLAIRPRPWLSGRPETTHWSILHLCVEHDLPDMARQLIDSCQDENELEALLEHPDTQGRTALVYAVGFSRYRVLEVLLLAGAEASGMRIRRLSLLEFAEMNDEPEAVATRDLLMSHNNWVPQDQPNQTAGGRDSRAAWVQARYDLWSSMRDRYVLAFARNYTDCGCFLCQRRDWNRSLMAYEKEKLRGF